MKRYKLPSPLSVDKHGGFVNLFLFFFFFVGVEDVGVEDVGVVDGGLR